MTAASEPSAPGFMSAEHVALMNAHLATSATVRQAVATLDREIRLAYRLRDEDSQAQVWWQVRFSPQHGVTFALGDPETPADVTLVGGYWDMIEAVQAQRSGRTAAPALQFEGDATVLQPIGAILAAAQAFATVPVTFPSRGVVPASREDM